jgi:hypothetical protein
VPRDPTDLYLGLQPLPCSDCRQLDEVDTDKDDSVKINWRFRTACPNGFLLRYCIKVEASSSSDALKVEFKTRDNPLKQLGDAFVKTIARRAFLPVNECYQMLIPGELALDDSRWRMTVLSDSGMDIEVSTDTFKISESYCR